MAPLLQSFSQLAVAGLAFISTTQASTASWPGEDDDASVNAAKVPLRLMPLGASITYGIQSSTGNGYREDLYELLANNGYSINMVGSRKHGSMKDNDNEGWPGFRIDQVEAKAKIAVPSRLPNVFTLNAGTNDCVQNHKIDAAGHRTAELLEYLWKASPGSTVILSTLVLNLNPTVEARVQTVNKQIRAVATEKAAEGKRVVLADMHSADGPQKGDISSDGTHPTDGGYEKMAKIWYRSIQTAANKGLLQKPRPVPKD
ncbi:hypothetical protein QQS21_009165 [Conoideocrella luteorostrata]|uniref:SGNH hydrolase-type esterase domain-containing protein n=1 Tax=Conoideocrella luteorostrata TaxID=1105319 RepID=A0AAJ0CHG9_9HYPO|nr:hypothetical protein QQS21_009165 [Conoideocrella luteorostrata]